MEEKKLYRKVALDRLSSPEQLDRLMTITRPTGWLALLGIAVVVISALIWGIWGSIPTKIYGDGILIRSGGIRHIIPMHSGHLTDIRIQEGDEIKKGQVVARISQPELELEMVKLNQEIKALMNESNVEKNDERNDQSDNGDDDGSNDENNNNRNDENDDENDDKSENDEKDNKNGDKTDDKSNDDLRIKKKIEKLEEMREDYLARTRIVSPADGRVLEVMKKQGNYISHNEPLLSFEVIRGGTRELETFLFVPAAQGQQIAPGMDVQVEPLMINREEYGFINGKVISVSEYPVSAQGMVNLLENEELVRTFSRADASVLVRVELIPDSGNMSGYQWSVGDGPPTRLESGTLISGAVIIKEEPPINKIIPLF